MIFLKTIFLFTVISLTKGDQLEDKYKKLVNTRSDINEHLPTLYKYALECDSIFETGVRGVVSSYSWALGLKPGSRLLLNDIDDIDISELVSIVDGKLDVTFVSGDNLNLDTSKMSFDLTFIDTWHVYGQLKRELAKFSPITKKYIVLHDTTIDGIKSESLRLGRDISRDMDTSGFTKYEVVTGLWKAVTEFIDSNPEWRVKERFTNNNGLTVLERIKNNFV